MDTSKTSLEILHNLVLSLCASLVYMILLVTYVKSTQGLTIDVQHEAIKGLWLFTIAFIMILLEVYDKRGLSWWLQKSL